MRVIRMVTVVVMVLSLAGVAGAGEKAGPSLYEGKININTASAAELARLPAIDLLEARSIVAYRVKNGHFSAIDDVQTIGHRKAWRV